MSSTKYATLSAHNYLIPWLLIAKHYLLRYINVDIPKWNIYGSGGRRWLDPSPVARRRRERYAFQWFWRSIYNMDWRSSSTPGNRMDGFYVGPLFTSLANAHATLVPWTLLGVRTLIPSYFRLGPPFLLRRVPAIHLHQSSHPKFLALWRPTTMWPMLQCQRS